MKRVLLVLTVALMMAAMMTAMALPAFAKDNCNADFSVCSGGSGGPGGGGGGRNAFDGTTQTDSGGGGGPVRGGGGLGFRQTFDFSTQEFTRQGSDNGGGFEDGHPSGPGRCSGTFLDNPDCVGKK